MTRKAHTRTVATVFGGSGFIGRHVVKRLVQAGHVVRVAVRDVQRAADLKPLGDVGQVVPLRASVTDRAGIVRAVDGAELVVNLIGILSERRAGDFQRIQGEAPGQIAIAAAEAGVERLVHISALGADATSPSLYARSKAAGEAALLAAFPTATVLRPSVVFGPDDQFFNRFAAMARLLPVMPVICGATRFQPVYVEDVADAVMAALTRPDAAARIYELGGPAQWSMRDVLRYVLAQTRRRRWLVEVPMGMARLQASIMEHLPGKPFTRDQLLLLGRDNVVSEGAAGLEALGVQATPIELVAPAYLARYRPGGGKLEDQAPK
jgi:NADH dehydrogenase